MLHDKTILVTGASSGLGKSLVKQCAMQGGRVIAASRKLMETSELTSAERLTINKNGGMIDSIQTDVRDAASVGNLFKTIDRKAKGIDLVINNAAVGHNSELQNTAPAEAQDIVSTNLLGTVYVTREFINRMLMNNSGHLVFISSLAGKLAFPGMSIYSATKFAIEGLVGALREELHATGISITIVHPGIIDTDFFKTAGMDEFAKTMKNKMQSPDHVAGKIIKAVKQSKEEITVGPDKRFIPLLKFLPSAIARKLLPIIT